MPKPLRGPQTAGDAQQASGRRHLFCRIHVKPNGVWREKIVPSRGLWRGLLHNTLFLLCAQRPAKPRTAVRFRSPPPRLLSKSTTEQKALGRWVRL